MKEKNFYERRDCEAVADAPQSNTIQKKTPQILSPGVKGLKQEERQGSRSVLMSIIREGLIPKATQ